MTRLRPLHTLLMNRTRPLALALLVACGAPGPGTSTAASTGDLPPSGSTGATTGADVSTEQATSAPVACPGTHSRVGWRAELATYHHGVAGTAEIRDDCTISVTDFTYDGTGIDVRFYGGTNEDYAGGFALSDNLLKSGGYAGESVVLTLPAGRSLDDLDGISVWCVDVEIDFGSGVFAAP